MGSAAATWLVLSLVSGIPVAAQRAEPVMKEAILDNFISCVVVVKKKWRVLKLGELKNL